ncbi:MAG TPA: transcription termination factor Rho [Gemmatimonadaceae bacterium]|nr:transcription termination factor Rho [Gemmatimonadaceae bacterium]
MDTQDENPYRESGPADAAAQPSTPAESSAPTYSDKTENDGRPEQREVVERDAGEAPPPDVSGNGNGEPSAGGGGGGGAGGGGGYGPRDAGYQRRERGSGGGGGGGGGDRFDRNGRRHRRHRGRGRRGGGRGDGGPGGGTGGGGGGAGTFTGEQQAGGAPHAPVVLTPVGDTQGWFDPSRDGGFIRRAGASYLAEPGDAWVSPAVVRQWGIRKGDHLHALVGRDQRGRTSVMEIQTLNGADPQLALKRQDFQSLTAAYPERKLYLETGRPAKGGHELTRRAIDLVAPIGYGQRALIVAPARAGKTTLLHAITEGIVINHPQAVLLILLVDERPEEVSEAISWGVGEVIASSFDQPAQRHVEVVEMVMEHARRLVEMGKDVIIVLDSLTRMARAHNTAERGTGRTLSGGLDATAMAKPKAFFGSARAIPENAGGGSLTIISTALVETGSRMDDVIFEEFKGTGNSEIKLDRSLADKRIYPAIDIATSGTRREEKLFKPEQLETVYALRRGLAQMPPQSAMEWLIKRIAATPSNDALLAGLI